MFTRKRLNLQGLPSLPMKDTGSVSPKCNRQLGDGGMILGNTCWMSVKILTCWMSVKTCWMVLPSKAPIAQEIFK